MARAARPTVAPVKPLLAILAAAAAASVPGLTACGGGSGAATTGPSPSTTSAIGSTIYVPSSADDGRLLAVPARPRALTGQALMGALASASRSPIPPGASVRTATRSGPVLTLDWSGGFADGYPKGGAAAEVVLLGAIVYSATESLPGVTGVRLLVEGRPADLPSQFDLSAPLTRADFPADLVVAE